jgi:hypothetical protein
MTRSDYLGNKEPESDYSPRGSERMKGMDTENSDTFDAMDSFFESMSAQEKRAKKMTAKRKEIRPLKKLKP